MKKKFLLLTSLSALSLFAAEPEDTPPPSEERIKTPQEIQAELDKAEKDFETAKSMFVPWYTGPLITGSANNAPPGKMVVQAYLFFLWQYAQFNKHRESRDVPDVYTLNPLMVLQRGLTCWLDLTFTPQAFLRWRQDKFAEEWGDLGATFGFQIVKETREVPSIRLTLGETFPTGKFQHLSPRKAGIDATGAGAFSTTVGLNMGKVFWSNLLHPTAIRLATNFNFPDHRVDVHGFNAYGGGFGTDGRICPPKTFNIDLGIEYSITQKWVLATDFAYTYSTRVRFHGKPGVNAAGDPASNGGPSSDNFSIAPAIEYNFSDSSGFIGGIWFPVTGRNSANFLSVIASYYVVF